MKLRFRQNSIRLRVNTREVEQLAAGTALEEAIHFPGSSPLIYILDPFGHGAAVASLVDGIIRVSAPGADIQEWAHSNAIGLYFQLAGDGQTLKISIEKDLECLDGPADERDPHAFVRAGNDRC